MWVLDFLPFWVFHLIVLVGIGGIITSMALKFIPFVSTYRMPIQIAAIAALVFGVYMEGGISNQEKWEAKVAEAKLEIAKKDAESANASVQIVTKYIDRVTVVKETGDAIIKEIPKYISQADDAQCRVPNGFVLLHDSASRNEIPDTTRGSNEGASEVKLSEVALTVSENYTQYYQVSEQLKSLQDWVRSQLTIYNK
jgi:hypothetical protein